MSDYSFSEDQKVSIWRADSEKCFYCRIPIPYSELQVDHIVPEKVSAEKLAELQPVLPAGFDINSIPNWGTCHLGCNIRNPQHLCQPLQTVEGGSALSPFDHVQEVQRHVGFLRQLLLSPAAGVAHFAQLCAETGSETHIVESWRQPPPEHQHKGVLPHSQTKADVAGTACRTGGTAAGGL